MKIYMALNAVMHELGAIGKDRKNTHQNYAFRGIEDMYNAIHPLLVKHKVIVVPCVLEKDLFEYQKADKVYFRSVLKVSHKFTSCEDFSSVEVITLGEGIDTSDKALNKSMSAAMKYAFIELFSIPTLDLEDADKTTPEIEHRKSGPEIEPARIPTKAAISRPVVPAAKARETLPGCISEAQAKRLHAIAAKHDWKPEELKAHLLAKLGVDSSLKIPREKYDDFCNTLGAEAPGNGDIFL